MKRNCMALLLGIVLLIPAAFAQDKKIALVSFYLKRTPGYHERLEMTEETKNAIKASVVNPVNFDSQGLFQKAYDAFMQDISGDLPFSLVPESEVLQNVGYGEFTQTYTGSEYQDMATHIVMKDGYKLLDDISIRSSPNRPAQRMADLFPGVDGIMLVRVVYVFQNRLPVTVGVNAYLDVWMWNRKGDFLVSERLEGRSKETIAYISGVMTNNPAKLFPLFASATDDLLASAKKELPGILKKQIKKLK